jgi:hypothetical protein
MAAINDVTPLATNEAGSFDWFVSTVSSVECPWASVTSDNWHSFSGPGVKGTSSKSSSSLAIPTGAGSGPEEVALEVGTAVGVFPNNSAAEAAPGRGTATADVASVEVLGGLENKADASIGALLDRWYPGVATGVDPKTDAALRLPALRSGDVDDAKDLGAIIDGVDVANPDGGGDTNEEWLGSPADSIGVLAGVFPKLAGGGDDANDVFMDVCCGIINETVLLEGVGCAMFGSGLLVA